MRRRANTLLLALCASLIVHLALMFVASKTQVVDLTGRLHSPGPVPEQRRQPPPATRPVMFTPLTQWGEAGGEGIAVNAAPGEHPLSAPRGIQDQSFGSRDPAGPARQLPPEPSMSTRAPGQGGNSQPRPNDAPANRIAEPAPLIRIPPPQQLPAAPPKPPQLPAPPVDLDSVARTPLLPAPPAALPGQNMQRTELVAPTPMPTVPTSPVATVATNSTPGIPGPSVSAADPAPDTGLESDPFSKTPGVEFRNGKVEARSGRKVKPVRPRLTEASRRDLLALQFPTILLKVRIDDTGKVQDVRVLRGSGSEAIDMPVYRALWQWWFEPPKGKDGKPLPDVQLVAIHWG